jgi:UV DNA damage endonuclease
MNLSLCCISKTLSDNGQTFRSMTYTQFVKQPFDSAMQELSQRILHNFKMTLNTIRFCQLNNIQGYRLSSSLAPILTHKNLRLRIADLPNFAAIKAVCESIKQLLAANPIRISAHPSEYITLSSDNPECIDNSIVDLEQHAEIFDLLGLPQDYRSPLNIHVRKDQEPEKVFKTFASHFERLSDKIKHRLVLEVNDNKGGTWNIRNLYEFFYKNLNIPITFDSLHNQLCNNGESEQKMFELAYSTWNTTPLFHFSEGVNGTRKHADYPTSIPNDFSHNVYWDCEFKAKDLAIQKIREFCALR